MADKVTHPNNIKDIYPKNFPAQTDKFSDNQDFKYEVFKTLREVAVETTKKSFEEKGYKEKEGHAGVYGDGSTYGHGIENDTFNVKLSSRANVITYFEKLVYLGARHIVSVIESKYNPDAKNVEVTYKSSDYGSYHGYGDTKNPNQFIHDVSVFNISSMPEFKKELKEKFEAFADKEVTYLSGKMSDVALKAKNMAKQMAENRIDKKLSLKDLASSSFEDLSKTIVNTIAESREKTEEEKIAELKMNVPETLAGIKKNKLKFDNDKGIENYAVEDQPNNLLKKYKSTSISDIPQNEKKAYMEALQKEKAKLYKMLSENDDKVVRIGKWTCTVEFGKYESNDRTAITLVDTKTGDRDFVATINMPEEELADDEVIIKDYSENEGMLEALIKAGIISKPVRYVGHIQAPVSKLLVTPNYVSEITAAGPAGAGAGAYQTPFAFKKGGDLHIGENDEAYKKTTYARSKENQKHTNRKKLNEGDNFWSPVELNPGSGYVPKGMEHNYVIGHHNSTVKDYDTNADKNFFGKNKVVKEDDVEKEMDAQTKDPAKASLDETQKQTDMNESKFKRKFITLNENKEKGVNIRYVITEKRNEEEEKNRWKKLALFETYETIRNAENIVECGCDDHNTEGFGDGGQNGERVTMSQGQDMTEKEFEQRIDANDGDVVDGKKVMMIAKPGSLSNAMFKVFEDDYLNENRAYIKDLNSGNMVANPNFKLKK